MYVSHRSAICYYRQDTTTHYFLQPEGMGENIPWPLLPLPTNQSQLQKYYE